MNAGLALMREITLLELCSSFGGDVASIFGLDPSVAAVRRILVEEAVGEFAATLEWCIAQEDDAIGRGRSCE